MEKSIIEAVICHLEASVPDLHWVDLEDGQLHVAERPPIALPACLIEASYVQCTPLQDLYQRVTVELRLTLVFDDVGSTHSGAPERVRKAALARYDILNRVHSAMQGWTNGGLYHACSRIRVTPTVRRDRLKVFNAIYQLAYIDKPTPL